MMALSRKRIKEEIEDAKAGIKKLAKINEDSLVGIAVNEIIIKGLEEALVTK